MAKALKPLIVILMILSVVSLSLGIMLFSQREIIKGRTQKLQDNVTEIAKRVGYEDFDAEQIKDFDKMDGPLNQLIARADNLREETENAKADRDKALADLVQANSDLETAQARIAELEPQIADLRDQMAQKDAEVAQANSRMNEVEAGKVELEQQIGELNEELVRAEDQVRELEDEIKALENALAQYEDSILGASTGMQRGLTGRILVVNPDWNFVVLDLGLAEELENGAEALVHREDRFIGKVRVSNVKDSMSVADIVRDWEQLPIQEGDSVLF